MSTSATVGNKGHGPLRRATPGEVPAQLNESNAWSQRFWSWWPPACVVALGAAFWASASRWPPSARYWLIWPEILLVSLVLCTGHREGKLILHGVRLDRLLLWAVFGLMLLGEILDGIWGRGREPVVTPLLTGAFGFVIAVEMMDRIPARHGAVFDRLIDRGVLAMTAAAQEASFRDLEGQARKWATFSGPASAVIVLGAWAAVNRIFSFPAAAKTLEKWYGLPLVLFSFLAIWVAGEKLGRMIAYGRSWRLFMRKGDRWQIMPGHPDRVGGFKPVGDFFFYESIVVAIPAIFLSTWYLIIWLVPEPGPYSRWLPALPVFLAAAIALEVLAFFLPMRSIHRLMRGQKTLLLTEADNLSRKIDLLQKSLWQSQISSERQQTKDSIADLTETCKQIEKIPTWPIDPSIRRRFSITNAALLLPFVELALKYWLR